MKNKFIKLATLAVSLLYVDLFCGAGGTSTGIETAKVKREKCAKVIVCVNHDPIAIASHAENHPDSCHFTEDIKTLDLAPVIFHIKKMRELYPFARVVLWASLECTNHSKAKGGMSRDADSRTLANHLFRYIDAINPDSVQIENVEEFLIWGPLMIKEIHKNNTSYCPLDLVTIDKKKKIKELRPIWIPIKERKAEYYNAWLDEVLKRGFSYDYRLLNAADFGAYTSRKRLFIQFNKNIPTVWPEQTHSKNPEVTLFGQLEKWKAVKDVLDLEDIGESIFDKIESDKTYQRILLGLKRETNKHFLTSYYGNGSAHSIDSPIGTLTTKDRYALHYIHYDYSSLTTSSINNPAGAVTTVPKHNLMSIQWLMDTQFGRVSKSIDEPSPTIIARQDKKPLYILQAERGYPSDFIKEGDSDVVKEIKEFMILNHIKSITMRMLTVQELKEIMGFPKDYILKGSKTDQKKFIGNAVEVTIARKICEATALRIIETRRAA
jgi:DNA (cytosine-5)-methyltransferase 1